MNHRKHDMSRCRDDVARSRVIRAVGSFVPRKEQRLPTKGFHRNLHKAAPAPDINLHYPQRQIERMVWVPGFLTIRAFFTLNETLPSLE